MSDRICTLPGGGRPEADPAGQASRCLASVACDFCDVCVLMCPELAITRDARSGRIVIDLEICKGCGLCAHYCPKGALKMVPDL